jgi:hypothetical protein
METDGSLFYSQDLVESNPKPTHYTDLRIILFQFYLDASPIGLYNNYDLLRLSDLTKQLVS